MAATYCTEAEVREQLELVSAEIKSKTFIENTIEKHSEPYINSRLGNCYEVPFSTIYPIIRSIASDISCYFILRVIFASRTPDETDFALIFKKSADEMIDRIIEGEANIFDDSGKIIDRKASFMGVQILAGKDEDSIIDSEYDEDDKPIFDLEEYY